MLSYFYKSSKYTSQGQITNDLYAKDILCLREARLSV